MSLPQINPLVAKLMGGRDYKVQLRDQLLARAERTDDPAFAARLREAADGKRPLRTLLADPAFLASERLDDPATERAVDDMVADQPPPMGTPAEVREQVRAELLRRGVSIPSLDEARGLLPDVLELQREADAVIAEERTRGWGGSVDRIAEQRRAAAEGDRPSGEESEQR